MITAILALMVVALWLAGAFLMRGLIKMSDADDSWFDVIAWPYIVARAVYECLQEKRFKW